MIRLKAATIAEWLFFLFVGLYILVIIRLPLFPTGDGPLHIYYANVFRSLLVEHSIYNSFYQVRHVIQPYCLHYFLLILLERVITAEEAEKLFVAIIVLNTAFGFRFLVHSLGRNASVAPLFIVPLLFSWCLSAGFLNYCFATGALYWAIGLYFRLACAPPRAVPLISCFGVSLIALILSHPVPLMLLAGVIACDLGFGLVEPREVRQAHWNGYAWGALALTCGSLLAPLLLVDKSRVSSIAADLHPHIDLLKEMISGNRLVMFGGSKPLSLVSRYGTVLLVPLACALVGPAAFFRAKRRSMNQADRLFVIGLILLVMTLTLPHAINGSYYFPQRIWDLAWPLAMAPIAGSAMSRGQSYFLIALSTVLITATLWVGWPRLRHAASVEQELSLVKLPREKRGLFVEPDAGTQNDAGAMTYPVFYWAGARAFMQNHDVLLNSPWISQSTMPVRSAGSGLLTLDSLPGNYSEHPSDILKLLSGKDPARAQLLEEADFIFYADPGDVPAKALASMQVLLNSHLDQWRCQSANSFALCIKP